MPKYLLSIALLARPKLVRSLRGVVPGLLLPDWMRLPRLWDTSTAGFGLRQVGWKTARTSQVVSVRGTSWFARTNTLTFHLQWQMTADTLV
jgi:hypothetical protein